MSDSLLFLVLIALSAWGYYLHVGEIRALFRGQRPGPKEGSEAASKNRVTQVQFLRRSSVAISLSSLLLLGITGLLNTPVAVTLFFVGTSLGAGVMSIVLSVVLGVLEGLQGREGIPGPRG